MIHDEEFETLPREALDAIQLKRLQQLAEKVYATVPFYKKAFDEKGVKPHDIKCLDDLQKLPFHETGFEGQLSFCHVCHPNGKRGPYSRVFRNDGQTDRGRLYAPGH